VIGIVVKKEYDQFKLQEGVAPKYLRLDCSGENTIYEFEQAVTKDRIIMRSLHLTGSTRTGMLRQPSTVSPSRPRQWPGTLMHLHFCGCSCGTMCVCLRMSQSH
jgi:hypothetical protein